MGRYRGPYHESVAGLSNNQHWSADVIEEVKIADGCDGYGNRVCFVGGQHHSEILLLVPSFDSRLPRTQYSLMSSHADQHRRRIIAKFN